MEFWRARHKEEGGAGGKPRATQELANKKKKKKEFQEHTPMKGGIMREKFDDYVLAFQSYKAATVELREGQKLLDEVAQDIENMMLLKISAVKVSGGVAAAELVKI